MTTQTFVTKRELAATLKVFHRTIDGWMAKGWLPYVKIGKSIRFLPADVEKFIASRRVEK